MGKIIIYVSFLIGTASVSGTIDFDKESIRYWDGHKYQTAYIETFNLDKKNRGTIKANTNGKNIFFVFDKFSIKYYIKNEVIVLRIKQKQ